MSDSKSLVVASDAKQKELHDNLLTEVCRVKSDGSSLSKVNGVGKLFYIHVLFYQRRATPLIIFTISLMLLCCLFHTGECQTFSNSESRTEVLGIASLLGKSTGLFGVVCC